MAPRTMPITGVISTDSWFPVVLLDDDDGKTPETGKAFGDMTIKYSGEADTSLTTYTIATDDWKESGEGMYWLRMGDSEWSALETYEVSVACTGCRTFRFAVSVQSRQPGEIDPRQGGIQLEVPAGFQERAGVVSENITRSGHPDFGVHFTTATSPLESDFDPRTLIGAITYAPSSGGACMIVGGYWFQDSDDTAHSVFGVAKDPDLFGITEGGTTIVDTNWTGSDLVEGGNGFGWTFITLPTALGYGNSGQALELYHFPGPTLQSVFNDMFDIRRMWIENTENENAVKITTDGADAVDIQAVTGDAVVLKGGTCGGSGLKILSEDGWSDPALYIDGDAEGIFINSQNSHGIRILAATQSGDGDGVHIEGAGDGHGFYSKGGTTGNTSGMYAQGNGSSDGISAVGGATGNGILAIGGATDGVGIMALGGPSSGREGVLFQGDGAGTGLKLAGGKGIEAAEIGTPANLGDGASLSAMLTAIAGKTASAASYDRTTDSNEAISDAVSAGGGSLTAQEVRDAMKLAPTAGAPAADSVDDKLDGLETDIGTVDTVVDSIKVDTSAILVDTATIIAGLAVVDGNVDTIVAKLPAGDIAGVADTGMKLTDTVDSTSIELCFELLLAMVNGRFVRSVPSAGVVRTTFYKRDNTTVLFQVDTNATTRARL